MPQRQAGFTLLELMLVLAIIAMIGAIMVPKLDQVFERQKLEGAAKEMRLKWDTARLNALRTGQAQVFQCTLGTGTYVVKPLVLQSDISNVGQGATVMSSSGGLVETQSSGFVTAADTSDQQAEELEDRITFLSCNVAGDMRAYTVAQDAQSSMMASDINTQTVGQAVIFYPDGSTSTAEVRLQNERGEVRAIQLRGLTGHSRIVAIANVASSMDESEGGR